MCKYKVKGGFNCDRQSKYDFTASTVNYVSKMYHGKDITVVFKEIDGNGNLVDFDSSDASIVSRTDLIMFFNDIGYNIELKERWGKYHSEYYGKEGDKEGWFVNIEKYDVLMNDKRYIPIFANLFPDGKVRLWNLNELNNLHVITKNIAKINVIESDVIPQKRYDVYNKDGKVFKRIKGEKSNGIWMSW